MPDSIIPQKRKTHTGFRESHAFIIGINQYPLVNKPLLSAVPDAWKLATILWEKQGFDHVWLLINPGFWEMNALLEWLKNAERLVEFPLKIQASIQDKKQARLVEDHLLHKDNFAKDGNQRLAYRFHHGLPFTGIKEEEGGEGDSVVFYYAGHGQAGTFGEGPSGYLLPMDVSNNAEMDNKVPMEWVQEALEAIACKHSLLILDCCFAGKFRHTISKNRFFRLSERRPITAERFERFKRKKAWQVLVSAGPDQTAADWISERNHVEETPTDPNARRIPHSPFACALFRALDGAADFKHMGEQFGDGVLTATELKLYLFDQVEKITNQDPDFKIQHPDLFEMNKHDGGEFIFINPNAPALKFAEWQHLNPYKGLMPYEANDWPFFFGRKTAIADIEKKLKKTPILLISAPSGIGKSSLVKAGVFPKLEKEAYETYVFRPGAQPWSGQQVNVEKKDVESYWTGLEALMKEVEKSKGEKCAILLDQYEGLFQTAAIDKEEQKIFEEKLQLILGEMIKRQKKRNAFELGIQDPIGQQAAWENQMKLEWVGEMAAAEKEAWREKMAAAAAGKLSDFKWRQLKAALLEIWEKAHGKKLLLFITLRSDFEWQFENSSFGKELKSYAQVLFKDQAYTSHYRPAPMGLDELREALISPALIRGFEFESEELVGEILEEIGYAPAALPLLSLSMKRLFEIAESKIKNTEKDKRIFTRKMYKDELGGISGALNKMADDFYKSLNPTEEKLGEIIVPEKNTDLPLDANLNVIRSPRQRMMRKIFLRMLQLNDGEYSARKIFFNKKTKGHELDFPDEAFDSSIWDLLDDMVETQLIVIGEDENSQNFITPAHDTLLNHWDTCRHWVEEFGRDNLILQEQLWQAVLEERKGDQAKKGEAPDDVLVSNSAFWDNNLKLLQLLNQIHFKTEASSANEEEKPNKGEEYFSELLSPLSEEELLSLFNRSEHWLNKAEIRFVIASWQRKNDRVKKLTAERDAAIAAKNRAEIKTKESEALAITAVARTLPPKEIITSLQLMKLACSRTEPNQVLPLASQTLSEKFYSQFAGPDQVAEPFYSARFWHARKVSSAVFSPDGQSILTASWDNTAKLWNLKGDLLADFTLHTKTVCTALFSPDGQSVITVSKDKTVRLWDLEGDLLADFKLAINSVQFAVLSPDGKSLLITSEYNGYAQLWNLKGDQLATFDKHDSHGQIYSAVFSSDGQNVLTASKDKTAKLWNLKGDLLVDFDKHTSALTTAIFSPDEQYILTGSMDDTAKLWTIDGEVLAEFKHAEMINSAAFSPDGQNILTASNDRSAKLWNLNGDLLIDFDKHNDWVVSAIFSPNGKSILTASLDGTAKLWSLKSNLLIDFNDFNSRLASAIFSPNGQSVLTIEDNIAAKLWNIQGCLIADFNQHKDELNSAVFSPDEQLILTASLDKTAKLWDVNGTLLADLDKHEGAVNFAIFSPDGQRILTTSPEDGRAILWNLKGELLVDFDKHVHGVEAGVFSPDGQLILSYSLRTLEAKLWNLQGELLADFNQYKSWLSSATFSPDGQTVLIASMDGTAKLWSLDGKVLAEFKHTRAVYSAVFSLDGQSVLTASDDRTAKLWDIKGRLLTDFKHTQHNEIVYSAIFSPDEQSILTTTGTNTAKLWNLKGELLAEFNQHTESIYSAVFSPDGQNILTASNDKTVKLWNLKGELVTNFDKLDSDSSAIFSPDGQSILTTDMDKMAKLWTLDGELLTNFNKHTRGIRTALFSSNSQIVLTASWDGTAKLWPTPKRIYDYLVEESPIPNLSYGVLEKYGLQ